MPEKISIEAAQKFAEAQGLRQLVLVGWDGQRTYVVTWGANAAESVQAAAGGNSVKEALGWPDELCRTVPEWYGRLKSGLAFFEAEVHDLLTVLKGAGLVARDRVAGLERAAELVQETLEDVQREKFPDTPELQPKTEGSTCDTTN